MRVACVIRLVAVWLVGSALGAAPRSESPDPGSSSDEAAIRQLITAYAKSVDTVDTTLASAIWGMPVRTE